MDTRQRGRLHPDTEVLPAPGDRVWPLRSIAAGSGVMLALLPPPSFVEALADPDGEPAGEHHITLHYLGRASDQPPGTQDRMHAALLDFTAHSGYRGLTGRFGGYGAFPPGPGSDDKHVLIALWDIPGGAEFRTWLGVYLHRHGVRLREEDHGWIAHETIKFTDGPVRELPEFPHDLPEQAVFGSIVLAWAGEWQHYPLP
jgi:hypothetical protein